MALQGKLKVAEPQSSGLCNCWLGVWALLWLDPKHSYMKGMRTGDKSPLGFLLLDACLGTLLQDPSTAGHSIPC